MTKEINVEDPYNKLWIHKYRPTKLYSFISDQRDKLTNFYNSDLYKRSVMIISPHSGIGKTVLSNIIADDKFPDHQKFIFDTREIVQAPEFMERINKIGMSMLPSVCIVENVDSVDSKIQSFLRWAVETYGPTETIFILTSSSRERTAKELVGSMVSYTLNSVDKEEVKEYITSILKMEGIELPEDYILKTIDDHYPNIKSTIIDLQFSIETRSFPKIVDSQNLYVCIWANLLEKNMENVLDAIEEFEKNNPIDYYKLNKFIFDKAVEQTNLRLIQITGVNEHKFSFGDVDKRIIFISSLIDMVK